VIEFCDGDKDKDELVVVVVVKLLLLLLFNIFELSNLEDDNVAVNENEAMMEGAVVVLASDTLSLLFKEVDSF
jgi:hypothetical protein